ncbi:MAG TPA: hypothetical protein ENH15_05510 [Actinobacteria bacterium]|nr:hypothetical protein [Actinomycetota bacterium]
MSDTMKGQRLRGGVRPSRRYSEGRVCEERDCTTKISMYNRREFCHAHAPVRFPRVRGRILPEGT